MILQREVDLEVEKPKIYSSLSRAAALPAYHLAIIFLLFFAAVIGLQLLSGSYRSEFSAYPDEPAHYVTSLMIWDYIRHAHLASPLAFARNYYDHYPKVALGHWPPFFYLIQAAWMLLFSPSRAAVRLEIACTTAILALSVYFEIRKRFTWQAGLAAGLLCVALPLVQTYSAEEMAEAMLTLCCFWSTIFFAKYLESSAVKDVLYFAVFFSLAVLTKGNGWLLAMIPPIAILLTRRFLVLRQKALWLSVVFVAFCCLPWQLLTMRMAERGWEGGAHPSARYSLDALWEFARLFPAILGPVLFLMMLFGIYRLIIKPAVNKNVAAGDACLFALLISVWVFHSVVPAGVEDRKLIIAVPAMIYFLMAGAIACADLLPVRTDLRRWRAPAVFAVLTICFFLQTFSVPHIEHYGFDKAAQIIASRPSAENSTVLVSSQSVGEGLLVSELAMLRPEPVTKVIRATKALASVEWNGAEYKCLYATAAQMTRYLRDNHVTMVVVDRFRPQVNFLHDRLLRSALQDSNSFELAAHLVNASKEEPGDISIYRLKQ